MNCRQLHSRSDILVALILFFASRCIVFGGAIGAHELQLQPYQLPRFELQRGQLSIETSNVLRLLRKRWSQADAGWYERIAKHGYAQRPFDLSHQENWAFFPLFPLVLSIFFHLGLSPIWVGALVSNLCFFFSIILFLKIGRHMRCDKQVTTAAAGLLVFFPASYFYSIPVSESLFLLLSLLATRAIQQRHDSVSALYLGLLTATRATGILLLPAFLLLFRERDGKFLLRHFVMLVASCLGIVGFACYLGSITGNPLAFRDIQALWHRDPSLRSLFALQRSSTLLIEDWSLNFMHFISLLLSAMVSLHFIFRRNYAWAAYLIVPIFVALMTGSLLSISRFEIVLFPLFFGLAQICRSEFGRSVLLALFASLLALFSALYGLGVVAALA